MLFLGRKIPPGRTSQRLLGSARATGLFVAGTVRLVVSLELMRLCQAVGQMGFLAHEPEKFNRNSLTYFGAQSRYQTTSIQVCSSLFSYFARVRPGDHSSILGPCQFLHISSVNEPCVWGSCLLNPSFHHLVWNSSSPSVILSDS